MKSTSHHSLYQLTRVPFGLSSAPATFQSLMDVILSTVKWKYAVVYLEDIVIFSRAVEEHIKHTGVVSRLFKDAGVALKVPNSAFLTNKVDYLGHVIWSGRLIVASHSSDAVRERKTPYTVTELQSFVGLCNVFKRSVLNFASIASPLSGSLKKTQAKLPWIYWWRRALGFRYREGVFISPPVLYLPKQNGYYTLGTDACHIHVIRALLQNQEEEKTRRSISYWPRTLTE